MRNDLAQSSIADFAANYEYNSKYVYNSSKGYYYDVETNETIIPWIDDEEEERKDIEKKKKKKKKRERKKKVDEKLNSLKRKFKINAEEGEDVELKKDTRVQEEQFQVLVQQEYDDRKEKIIKLNNLKRKFEMQKEIQEIQVQDQQDYDNSAFVENSKASTANTQALKPSSAVVASEEEFLSKKTVQ